MEHQPRLSQRILYDQRPRSPTTRSPLANGGGGGGVSGYHSAPSEASSAQTQQQAATALGVGNTLASKSREIWVWGDAYRFGSSSSSSSSSGVSASVGAVEKSLLSLLSLKGTASSSHSRLDATCRPHRIAYFVHRNQAARHHGFASDMHAMLVPKQLSLSATFAICLLGCCSGCCSG
jgi:hypothetical protein